MNAFRVNLALFVYSLVLIYVIGDVNHDKRILLSDPAYVQQQMTHLQSELQTLQATVQSQTVELLTLQTTMQSQTAQLQSHEDTIQKQNGKISSLEQQLSYSHNGGVTFVRWGRNDCPTNLTELVYSGFAGGSWYAHKGAASNPLCLPTDPEWLNTTVVPDDYTGRLYGAEYESNTGHTLFGSNSRDEEVPCAVCRPTSFASAVMIPARTTCYSGWTKAYGGSLSSGYYDFAAANEYVCIDEHAQALFGGADTNDNGVLFLGVKAFCGSLRCPPYKQDKYISCVVCMK